MSSERFESFQKLLFTITKGLREAILIIICCYKSNTYLFSAIFLSKKEQKYRSCLDNVKLSKMPFSTHRQIKDNVKKFVVPVFLLG